MFNAEMQIMCVPKYIKRSFWRQHLTFVAPPVKNADVPAFIHQTDNPFCHGLRVTGECGKDDSGFVTMNRVVAAYEIYIDLTIVSSG